ncbi:MAG: hypothetical protein NC898_03070 [Candidatus Omnitrophica bacterium]|nr:hypothetical protein [Candidatus Omnitrophota bacterium]
MEKIYEKWKEIKMQRNTREVIKLLEKAKRNSIKSGTNSSPPPMCSDPSRR